MSWSLAIQHGDLAFGSNGLNTVTGGGKLVQDLSCDVLEPMGTDPMHPAFGSLIDGGVDTNGTYYSGVIGAENNQDAATLVRSEIQRICRSYQAQQVARNAADVSIYGKSTLTADEALLGIGHISTTQVMDQLLVTANLETGSNSLPLTATFNT